MHVHRQSGGLSQSKLVNLEVDGKDWNVKKVPVAALQCQNSVALLVAYLEYKVEFIFFLFQIALQYIYMKKFVFGRKIVFTCHTHE